MRQAQTVAGAFMLEWLHERLPTVALVGATIALAVLIRWVG